MADEAGERMARMETTVADLREDVRDLGRRVDGARADGMQVGTWLLEKARLDERALSLRAEIDKLAADLAAARKTHQDDMDALRKRQDEEKNRRWVTVWAPIIVGAVCAVVGVVSGLVIPVLLK